ncbi:hypothetical protein BCON_0063g00540 [Botryotinia convoluta]|uniref:Uncharacterized protein n=1 Tax=Botryotinia convoluta TaxID=54673 RepID=A0A4Z1I8A8_9HELO|nr:hypothetical protein BCON_0063g00540 [Botryotinia convoluta]
MNGSSLVAPTKQVVDVNSGPEWRPQDDHAFSSENPPEGHLDSIVADEKLEQASGVDAESFSGQIRSGLLGNGFRKVHVALAMNLNQAASQLQMMAPQEKPERKK